ncbi:MFS transporter [Streptomyces sp. NBC_00201]|uniref:MFS transporter n=1 Tax=unclassified Streptomyces TaxID=2593676 RepID=UPI00225956CC|nr:MULTISPECIES: MFS transporter [unclassified Streptomyces]MCX5053744.1 MFS transporter [Streptomyces sp. NBC_00474]MCX5252320.1 MFS transporter [Streptomyces sp. NBC_00201]MCX5290811.1 MFS transporter [Streptomyces sp. NBC_00183]
MGSVRPAAWRRSAVVAALMLAAFTFNTAENLPTGLLSLMAADLRVSPTAVGALVTGYGLTVAVVSLPAARLTRSVPRRYLLAGLLGLLAAASWVSALGSISYALVLAARVGTALAQASFWVLMGPVAVGLFPPGRRGRVMGLLSVGGSLATVLGVPAGTWLGGRGGWHAPFAVLGALALVSLVVVAALLPTSHPQEGHAAYGVAPDRRRFFVVVATTALSVTGVFAGFTYVVVLLEDVGGFGEDAVSGVLFAFGAAALAGVALAGPLLDRFPRATLTVPVATQAAALLGLYAAASSQVAAVALLMLLGASVAPVFMATQSQVLRVAPGRTESALAANSAAFNAGVAAGALLGGALLPLTGARGTFLAGGMLTVGALAVLTWPEDKPVRAVAESR